MKRIFRLNGYPVSFIYNCLNLFLENKFEKRTVQIREIKTHKIVFKIPYIGKPSLLFKKSLTKLCAKYLKDTSVFCTFSSFKIQNYFSLKTRAPKALSSNVVYKFVCQVDPEVSYIGKTKRHLCERVKEHRYSKSAISDHLLSCLPCSDNFNCNSFTILSTCRDSFAVPTLEALYIKDNNPILNQQLASNGTSTVLCVF